MAKKTTNLLDELSSKELEEIRAYQASTEGAYPVDQEWLILTEFAEVFGWEAYLDAKYDRRFEDGELKGNLKVNLQEMLTLIEAHRKLQNVKKLMSAHSSFIGAVAATQKNPGQAYKSLTKDIINRTKVND